MGEFFGAVVGSVLLFYLLFCAISVPLDTVDYLNAKRTCEREHNVFQCEKTVIWSPVAKDTDRD